MFGLSTFAQAPFASLGGTRYDVDVAESATLGDVFAISKVDYAGLVNDSIALTDDVPNQFNYFLTKNLKHNFLIIFYYKLINGKRAFYIYIK